MRLLSTILSAAEQRVISPDNNLLLNVPARGDGSIDEKEEKVLEGIAA
jgi:alpha-L-fucosidase